MHESKYHKENSFITLTYNDKHLPTFGGLNKKHYELFMKKLRKHLKNKQIKFYMCGEYGNSRDENNKVIPNELGRPHYHAIIFGHQFEDLKLIGYNDQKDPLYMSPTLEKIWGKGICRIGELTFDSAAYVARYIVKKQTGDNAEHHYTKPTIYGEAIPVEPEYTNMSRGGTKGKGIGHTWFEQYKDTDLDKDFITVPGKGIFKIPRYYDSLTDPLELEIKKEKRREKAKASKDNTPQRLKAREVVKKVQASKLIRDI